MLVLTRKSGQKLIIDHQIELTVLEVRGDAVKLGLVAPRHVTIYREEIYEEIKRANQQAQPSQSSTLDQATRFLGKQKPSSRG